ncbi:IclR family transcriptional regulator [Staphylococcus intermedius]|uniref:Transcriptional regulator, IclR family n=1 Tax=Staphylococcus intermedius NCTC 11048 TaxID=1141106 RepID=A0A380G4Z1_STAIN|nr:IclR family transcriptional regulator [Staphylococcus intermedius]PCF64121.1 transcriptional regulator [Staphylococcus intermedius]PCF78836.1 transcriptional regulator [Staphylococcus intermedius]PCF79809.1 transcriptional regulator [Staphylococcus intermedius]PNZ54796.1 IclR family transcriptional regulator [Staphylococcus intermedius NCTC 11048]SUM45567.1 transcriptional regulator, IclR family [Staphylococcus intermedius NCTC 11048]
MAEYTPIKTVIQAFDILDILSQHPKMGISEMARLTTLPKSTIYRHLRTLVDLNVVAQDKDENYYLGYKMLKYQNHMKQTDSLIHHVKPYMRRLVEKTGEAINLGILVNQEVCILHTEHGEQYTLQAQLGPTSMLHCSGMGKWFLNTFTDEALEAYFKTAVSRTIHTITDVATFKHYMATRPHQDIVEDREEYEYGLMCIATPIKDETDTIQAAISISGPVSRLEQKGLGMMQKALLEEAQSASDYLQDIGYWTS